MRGHRDHPLRAQIMWLEIKIGPAIPLPVGWQPPVEKNHNSSFYRRRRRRLNRNRQPLAPSRVWWPERRFQPPSSFCSTPSIRLRFVRWPSCRCCGAEDFENRTYLVIKQFPFVLFENAVWQDGFPPLSRKYSRAQTYTLLEPAAHERTARCIYVGYSVY